jgi:hypothetical protein
MTDVACPRHEECNVPLCPQDESSMKNCIWYPDEDICPKVDVPAWVKRQRKIAKRTGSDFEKGYFNHRMLSVNCRIKKGIWGLDPDKDELEDKQIEKWLLAHPPEKPMSEERKETARTMLKKLHKSQTRPQDDAISAG